MNRSLVVEPAHRTDIAQIMRLERAGFAPGIVERERVFRARLATFPAGFLVLRDGATGQARGYLAMERWGSDPGTLRAAYALGHDPAQRYSPDGTLLYIASMTVDPVLRGLGLGGRLFREGRALVLGQIGEIALELLIVHESWRGARRIYEREGFGVRATLAGFFPAVVEDPRGRPDGETAAGTAALLMQRRVPGRGTAEPPRRASI